MATAPIVAADGIKQGTVVRKTGSDSANDKEMFLKLLIAQLKNQDPSSPMDSKDMMQSITQMSQVEQQINQTKALTSLALTQSVGMVDKTIQFNTTIKDAEGNVLRDEIMAGKVDHVVQKDGAIKLAVQVLGKVNNDGSVTPATTNAIVSVDVNDVTLVT